MFWKTEDGEVDKRCLFLVLLLTGAIVAGGLYICSPFFYGSGEEVPAEESISLESEKGRAGTACVHYRGSKISGSIQSRRGESCI